MIWLYRFLFPPAILLASPYYLMRMRRRGGYREHFGQRFGATPVLPAKRPGVRRVWMQAVSVGEMLAVAPLLEALRADPAVEVYLTTTTSTGYALAHERFTSLVIGLGYFPVDWWPFSRRAWTKIDPDLVILPEGERWPEHIRQAEVRGVPVLAINARLSDRSFRRMLKLRALAVPLFRGITHVLACSEHDADRFREIGLAPGHITTTGNIKLDVSIPLLTDDDKNALRRELGFGDEPVLLGSSTWPGEEAALVEIYKALRAEGRVVRLLIVPRHAERRAEVEALLQTSGLPYHFRSRGPAPAGVNIEVAVGDTTGELRRFTQLAELVFIGKSLPPHHEGQTPVEAAVLGKPVVFGPELSNFRAISREMLAAGAALSVPDVAGLRAAVLSLWSDAPARARMSAAAQAWRVANQGAVARTLKVIRDELARRDK
ncbi:MAG: glycosyltransferase N-terminal domain-containing protein [Opitutaceae bacterium]|jgi:3-deoxy-D-manno-octulosonic-acid transferase